MARHAQRLIRWLACGILALMLLVLAALAVLWWWFDPNDWRPEIEARASAAIGRPVRLTGALRWQPGKQIILHSEGGEIANAAGLSGEPLASWAQLEFDVAARPLLRRQVQIDHITMNGLRLNLARDARGNANWNLQPPTDAPSSTKPWMLQIGAVTLRDGDVRYHDAGSGADWQLQQLAVSAVLPVDLTAAESVLRNLQLQGVLHGAPVASEGVRLALQAPVVRQSPQEVALPGFTAHWADATLHGSVNVKFGAAPEVAAQLALQAPSLRDLLATANIKPPLMRDVTTLGKLELGAALHLGSGAVQLEKMSLLLDDTHLEGAMSLPRLQPLALRFDLDADRMSLDRYREPGKGKPLELPLAWLKQLDARGTLRIREASIEGAVAKDVRIDVR